MIKCSKHILKFSNKNKLIQLEKLFEDYKLNLQNYIEGKDLTFKHSGWIQIIQKNGDEIIKSCKSLEYKQKLKRFKKVYKYFSKNKRQAKFLNKKFSELNLIYKKKPEIKNIQIILDQRVNNIKQVDKEFNEFIKVFLPYFQPNKKRSITLNLPIKYHKQSLKYSNWIRKKSIGLQKINGHFYVTFFYEKEIEKKQVGNSLGIDLGYKKLITTSNGDILGKEMEKEYLKLSKMKRGSKNYKQRVIYKNNQINYFCNQLNLQDINLLVLEDLKNVKKNKRRINKLQYWSYLRTLKKLESLSNEQGIELVKVSPAYTSQTCSSCGHISKESRNGQIFTCVNCSYTLDADLNAAINIRNRGVYSLSNNKKS